MKRLQNHWVATAALALATVMPASAQTPAVVCTPPADMAPAQLYGLWQLVLWPQVGGSEAAPASTGALLFERHPEYPGSVRGSLKRTTPGNDRQALVSGDVTGGEFNLDESADGVTMDAVWEGNVTASGCGQELRGIRRPAEGSQVKEPLMNFVLLKLYQCATPGSLWFRVLSYNLSRKLKPFKVRDDGTVARSVFSPYFDANQLLVQIMTYLGIILTFGAVFPPLAVVMMAAIVSIILSKKLILGRFIFNAVEQKVPQFISTIELDAEGVGRLHVSKLRVSGWMLASFAFCFYTLFLFDLLGNEVGFAGSFWVFIVLPLKPVGIYLIHKLSRERGRASLWHRFKRCIGVGERVVVVEKDCVQGLEMAPVTVLEEGNVAETQNPLNKMM